MSTTKKRKRSRKPVRFQMSRLAILGWCSALLVALLWMFLLGLFVGKGINPASINFAEIKKRMIDQGVWPGTGKTQQREATSQDKKTRNHIPLEDLEFYEELAKKKAKFQKQNKEGTPSQKGAVPKVSPPSASPPQQAAPSQKQQRRATGKFTVQLASFRDLQSAKRFAARFKDLKPRATVRQADLTGSGESIVRNQKFEPLIKDGLVNMAKLYAQKEALNHPLISPVFADLKGLPPLLIQAGGIEALVDDSITLANRAKEAGVEVKLEVFENMTHVFQNFGEELSESRKAFENVNDFIQKIII